MYDNPSQGQPEPSGRGGDAAQGAQVQGQPQQQAPKPQPKPQKPGPRISIPKNRRLLVIIGIMLVVFLVLVVALHFDTVISVQNLTKYDNVIVPSSFLARLQIPDNISNAVGLGSQSNNLLPVSGTPMYNGTKPVIVYVGAEYCPYCAAERWAMLIALMRFGSFTGIRYMTSTISDYSPSTPTFTFYNSTYTSSYVVFDSVETETNTGAPLQKLSELQNATYSKYDLNNVNIPPSNRGGIPFIDFANKTMIYGSSYLPENLTDPGKSILYQMNWSGIAGQLSNPSSRQSQAIIGTANLFTAQICMLTNNTPSGVCSQPYVANIEKILGNGA